MIPILVINLNSNEAKAEASDSILIQCNDYFSGMQEISVYTNYSYDQYELLLNGSVIRNTTNNDTVVSHTWYPLNLDLVYGENENFTNITNVYYNDSDYYYVRSESVYQGWFDWDEQLIVDVIFTPYSIPVSCEQIDYTSTRVQFEITNTYTTDLNDLRVEGYNFTANAWQTLWNLGKGNTTTINSSLYICDFKDNVTDLIYFRVYGFENTNGNVFDIEIDYFTIYYEVNYSITGLMLIDNLQFNSSDYADGNYNLTARIRDLNGAWHQVSKNIIIDNTAPTVSYSVNKLELTNVEAFDLNATITDANLDDSHLQYENVFSRLLNYNPSDPTFIDFMDILTNGTYVFRIIAQDLAGNTAIKSLQVNVSYQGAIEILQIFRADENGLLVDIWSNNTQKMLIYIDNELMVNVSGNSSYYDMISLDPGEHKIYVETWVDGLLYNSTTFIITIPGGTGNGNEENGNGGIELFAGLAMSDWLIIIILILVAIAFTYYLLERRKR